MTAEEMARIHRAAFTLQRPWAKSEFDTILDHPSVFVANRPNGFGLIRVIAPEAEILTLAVHPDAQGNGLGTAILRDLCALAAANGATELQLEVAAKNVPALALYGAAGFVETSRRADYYRYPAGGMDDAILMTKPLPG